jgi:hypothetical protein
MGLAVTRRDVEKIYRHDPCWYSEARGFSGYEPTYDESFRAALNQWRSQRLSITEIDRPKAIEASRLNSSYGYREFLNCNADAFRNATKVLSNRLGFRSVRLLIEAFDGNLEMARVLT